MLKININYKHKLILSLLVYISLVWCCDHDYGPLTTASSRDTNAAMLVAQIRPYQIITGNEFLNIDVGVNAATYPISATLYIYKHSRESNSVYSEAITFNSHNIRLITVIPNSFTQTGEDYYYVGLISNSIPWARTLWSSFVWGFPKIDNIPVNIGLYHMEETISAYYNAAILSVDSTYNYPVRVGVEPIFSSTNNPVPNNYFGSAFNRAELTDALADYTSNNNLTSDTFRLYFALNQSVSINLGGASYSWKRENDLNWSYVFMTTVGNWGNEYNRYSTTNLVTVHELLHQLGNLPDFEHGIHGGALSNYCILHFGLGHFFVSVHGQPPTYWWSICDRHIYMLRGNLLQNSTVFLSGAYDNFSQFRQDIEKSDKYNINMTLSKKEYKEFEPIYAKFKLINSNKEPLKIYNLFEADNNEAQFRIEDNLGNIWDSNKMSISLNFFDIIPSNIVQPGDTLILSMAINNWGEQIAKVPFGDRVFGGWAYFPAGRNYKAYFHKDGIKSNEVEFEVVPLNEEDALFLQAYQDIVKKNTENRNIARNYPENTLTEYVTAANLMTKYWLIIWGDLYKYPDLVNDYNEFFKKYPNTQYLYNDKFIAPYIIKQFSGIENLNDGLSNIRSQNITDGLNTYFSDRNINSRINNIINYYKRNNK